MKCPKRHTIWDSRK